MCSYSVHGVERIITLRKMDKSRLEKGIRGKNIRYISNLKPKALEKESEAS